MKTSQALYDAIEAGSRLLKAMSEDMQDPDITREGVDRLAYEYNNVAGYCEHLEGVRDSLNEGD